MYIFNVLCVKLDFLTADLQADSASGASSRVAGHAAVLTSIDLLCPSNAQGPTVHIVFSKGSRAHLKLTWTQTKEACWSPNESPVTYLPFDLVLPLNQWMRGGGTPVARHLRVASPPTVTSTTCCATVTVGTSAEITGSKLDSNVNSTDPPQQKHPRQI